MNSAINQYRVNSNSIKELGQLYDNIIRQVPLLKQQADEILRAQFVMIISALDCFIHDVVRKGMLEIYQNLRKTSGKTDKYPIGFATLKQIESETNFTNKLAILEQAIQTKNSEDSFQSPTCIEYALGLINITKIWANTAQYLLSPPQDIRSKLSVIIHRRNKIAHEADRDNVTNTKLPIDKRMVDDTIKFIDELCEALFHVCNHP